FEDFDLGYRLIQKKGMTLLYNPAAVGYHYKKVSFKEVCAFPKKMAASRKIYEAKEAGQAFLAFEARRKTTRKYRLEMLFVRTLVPLLFPLRPLLDSRIPLPGQVYKAFYAYDVYFAGKSAR
ncbi:MAG: glycosyltransferase family 2 protein, partial [Terriglobia bacterium]